MNSSKHVKEQSESTDLPTPIADAATYFGAWEWVVPAGVARKLERDNATLRALWTEARVIVAKSRDANCLMSYGNAQADAVEEANKWLNKMPVTPGNEVEP